MAWFVRRARPRSASPGRASRNTPADTVDQVESDRCRDRADEGDPDVLLAGRIEPGDADGDRDGGPARQMEKL
jgi:hypothetical protein